jgi:flagellar M-ring protein FliF
MNASAFTDLWNERSPGGRIGLALAAAAILALAAAAAWWALRAERQPLFSELDPRDASAIATELERMKVPYSIADEGATILVDKSAVHGTRLKVMGKGLDLKGTVGFEIFNNTDFGMTEFAQKINYQRALQGELARTIGALEEVKSVRVHLVLPESGLLRRTAIRPKASVTLVMRGGQRLQSEQIHGIQRLVAAAVPEMEPGAVTVLDQQGVALSRRADAGAEGEAGASGRLEAKREIEAYLVRKAAAVLDQAFGPGRAIVSVDVALNSDHVKVTREDVLPAKAVSRRKESAQRPGAPAAAGLQSALLENRDGGAQLSGAMSSDVEYQHGRKIEQIVSSPGSVHRISVGVLLPADIPPQQAEGLKQVIAMAVGLNPGRGDALAFSWVGGRPAAQASQAPAEAKDEAPRGRAVAPPNGNGLSGNSTNAPLWIAGAGLLGVLCVLLFIALRRRDAATLSPKEREDMLAQLKGWIASGAPRQGTQP